jgi:hypothetical protein
LEILGTIAAAKFDDANCLAAAVGIVRELVELGELIGIERMRPAGRRCGRRPPDRPPAFRDGAIVEAKDALDEVRQIFGYFYETGAAAIGSVWISVSFQLDLKRLVEIFDGPGKHDAPAAQAFAND